MSNRDNTTKRVPVCTLRLPEPSPPQDDQAPAFQTASSAEGGGNNTTSVSDTESVDDEQYYDGDLSKLLEKHHFREYSMGRSFPSKGLFSVAIPEPKNPTATFVYNYFTPNERAFIEPNPESILYDSSQFNPSDIQFIASVDQEPRYVKLDFDQIEVNDVSAIVDKLQLTVESDDIEDFFMGSFTDLGENVTLSDIVEKITIEGASSNFNFTGVEIVDTFADKKIYSMLSSSITFQEIDSPLDSPRERAAAFRDRIRNDNGIPNPRGIEKLSLIDVLSELQSEGVALAPHDVKDDVTQLATDPITKQSFSTKFNNLFFDDLIGYNTVTANTVFEDELRSLERFSGDIQTRTVGTINPNYVYSHDHQMSITPINLKPINISANDINLLVNQLKDVKDTWYETYANLTAQDQAVVRSDIVNGRLSEEVKLLQLVMRGIANPVEYFLKEKGIPSVKMIGYMVQKTELLSDGSTQDFPNLFIDDPRTFSTFIDKQVRYGATYNYKIRTLALIKSCVAVVNESQSSTDYMIADYLVASDGTSVSVECTENIPPPAPVRINAYVDFEYRAPVITWEFPLNKQRDIKRFQVFKRKTINEPFVLLAEYDFDNSIYRVVPNEVAQRENTFRLERPFKKFRDKDFNLDFDEAIYAIASVDARGLTSNYSSQLHVKYDKYANKLHKNIISNQEAPKPYPNLYIDNQLFEDLIVSSGKKRCNIFFDPEYYKLYRKKLLADGRSAPETKDIELLKTSDSNFNYTFQMINIDLQEEQRVKIRIADRSGKQVGVPVSKISPTNLNFEFGTKS